MTELSWDPKVSGQKVRMRNDPGKQGMTTGKIKESAGRLLVEVDFGPNEKSLRKYDQLELIEAIQSLRDLFLTGSYGSLFDLRRILTYEKVKGQLTNILYSMESSNTDFYPHQFKPVLKFLDSPVGRILIADEVGLGKTIEAMFIWKELQARQDARRLLILSPSMLRDKWRTDLQTKFNMDVELINARELSEKIKRILQNSSKRAASTFVHIASLEGIRPPKDWEDPQNFDSRAELARLLYQNTSREEFSIFDLVIIDEAHYLRNPETASNQLGQLLRDASRYMVLLTATPIQISSNNLFQVLKLVSPDDFEYQQIFEQMLQANKHIIDALRYLCQQPLDVEEVSRSICKARSSSYFSHNSRLELIQEELEKYPHPDIDRLMRWRQTLESCSLLGQFMTRNRKRDVLENRVKRSPQALEIKFSPLEKQVYNHISSQVRKLAKGQKGVSLFSLIIRQRQMASCMVAALKTWKEKGILDQFIQRDEEMLMEDLWEDFGFVVSEDEVSKYQYPFSGFEVNDEDINQLKENDSKYNELALFLKEKICDNPEEKFVIFAYFRGTLEYLKERLEEDGISNCIIHGGIKANKNEVLRMFKNEKKSVLLSSEVGSEGIDLQFCRFLINYDLPWNPMRVEQRIGRLDRLGQTAERISIIHYKISDTVEERVLSRLYERINVFEESIGDLEEILGEETEHLIVDLLNSDLSEDEREERANQTLSAIANKKVEQERLETEAVNMVAFSDYILNAITQSREQGRWLRPDDLNSFIGDFFKLYYPETTIIPKDKHFIEINLSQQAKVDLRVFYEQKRLSTPTRLHLTPVTCFFDPKKVESMGKGGIELLDSTHPLIQWIRYEYEHNAGSSGKIHPFHGVSALEAASKTVGFEPGIYVYVVHLWEFQGLRTETRLSFRAVRVDDGERLPDNTVEIILDKALSHGKSKPNAANLINLEKTVEAYEECEEQLQFAFLEVVEAFEKENSDHCNVQEQSVRAYTQRRRLNIQKRIELFRFEDKLRTIPALEGQLKKLDQDCQVNLKKIAQKKQYQARNPELAAGLLFITK
ncbi:MAG: SNF2-related protein [Coleofasciculaceae cyanobacterium]